jgi:hypothetical protein
MELMSAREALRQAALAENEILKQQTEEISKTVVDLIKTMTSAGETYAVFHANKEYKEEAFTRVGEILREKGYFYKLSYKLSYDNYDYFSKYLVTRMEISWDTKNPFRKRYKVQ